MAKKNVSAIIQVRMSSERLPGKALKIIGEGKSLLLCLVERLQHAHSIDQLIVATSNHPKDDPIETFCQQHKIASYRGSLPNVALRFAETIQAFHLHAFARICADSPFLDQHLVDQAIELFHQEKADIVTNVFERTFPKGQSVEVVRASFFMETFPQMSKPEELEHVTSYFYNHSNEFRIHNFRAPHAYRETNLAVDTLEDYTHATEIFKKMKRPHWSYRLDEIDLLSS